MKMRPMKPAESRIAAIGLLLLVLVIAYFLLLHWWFVAPLRDIDSQMDDLRDTQSRYAAAIAQKPQLLKRIEELGHNQTDSSTFLTETDPNAASAALMQRVVDDAAAHAQEGSCEVSQKMPVNNPGSTSPNDPYQKVVVSISLHCDMQPLVGLLYTLEKGKPYLFVQDFSVYRNPLVNSQKNVAPLEVQFTLAGYVHASNAPGATPANPPEQTEDAPGGTDE